LTFPPGASPTLPVECRSTAGGAALFYGATLLIAAWRAQPACEATVLSNSILARDDQLGCPVFSLIDQAEARLEARNAGRSQQPCSVRGRLEA
jgi:hypothetical protein